MARETRRERELRLNRERVRRHREKKRAAQRAESQRRREVEALQSQRRVADLSADEIDQGIEWMGTLLVPDGEMAGRPFALQDWQTDWIRAAMSPGIQVAGLSIARKNAKTMLNVLGAACFLVGPWNSHSWNGIVCADVGNHAHRFFTYLQQVAKINDLDILFKGVRPPCEAYGKLGAVLEVLAADGSRTGHASNADIVWLDEAGALTENQRPLWNAMYSAMGARNGKMLCLGNQREGPMFAELEKRGKIDPRAHWVRYSAPGDCDPLDEDVWELANPGLGSIKSLEYMRGKALDAEISPANMTYFMSFDLNMDVDPARATIVTVGQWRECIDEAADLRGEPVVLGIDLGGSVSMSAAVAIGVETGAMRMWAAFSSIPDILSRGRQDGVDNTYVLMQNAGELRLYAGEHVQPSEFITDVLGDLAVMRCPILAVGADRYRRAELAQGLMGAGARVNVDWRGVGAGADGVFDIMAFQRLVFERELRTRSSLGMVNAILHSHIETDSNNNPKLMKNKSRGRIDLLSAGVLAAGLLARYRESGRKKSSGYSLLRSG